jgi:hypothetical protein
MARRVAPQWRKQGSQQPEQQKGTDEIVEQFQKCKEVAKADHAE